MIEPHLPPLRRQVVTNHPIEKSLRAVIVLQVLAGLGLVGTMVMVRMMQPHDMSSQCHWRGGSPTGALRHEPSSEPWRNSLAPPSAASGATPLAASPANCGTARVVNSGNSRTLQLRFDICPHGLQPEPTLAPVTTGKQRTRAELLSERVPQQRNSLEP